MESILIAGSNGIIGSTLSNSFLNSNISFTGIGYEKIRAENYTSVNLTNQSSVRSFVKENIRFDVLIFLTGLAHSKGKNKDYNQFYSVNFQTLKNLLDEMGTQNKLPDKIVFSSTISVYGERWDIENYEETLEPRPQSPYAKTKLLAEKYLLENYTARSWILRFNPVYSKYFLLNIERRTKIKNRCFRFGDGSKKLTLLNIQNISKVIFEILDDKLKPGVYNLSDSQEYTYKELLGFVGATNIVKIPLFFSKMLFTLGKISNNLFLLENSIKLGTDNSFTSTKLQKQVSLEHKLSDLKNNV